MVFYMHLSKKATIKCCCQEIQVHINISYIHTHSHSMDRPSGTWTDEAPSLALALAFGMPLAWPCTYACSHVCRYVYLFICIWQLNLLGCFVYVRIFYFDYILLVACLVMQESRCVWNCMEYVFGIRNGELL